MSVISNGGGEGGFTITNENAKTIGNSGGKDKVGKAFEVTEDGNVREITKDGNVRKEIPGAKAPSEMYRDELLRTMLSLFMAAPKGVDVQYVYAGSGDVDGNACEIVEAKIGNRSIAKLYLSQATNLPLMMNYKGMQMPKIMKFKKADPKEKGSDKDAATSAGALKTAETVEINVKFSDYKTVNGVLLPSRWTQTADGKADETVTIENYAVNPPDINEKFKNLSDLITIRTKKPE